MQVLHLLRLQTLLISYNNLSHTDCSLSISKLGCHPQILPGLDFLFGRCRPLHPQPNSNDRAAMAASIFNMSIKNMGNHRSDILAKMIMIHYTSYTMVFVPETHNTREVALQRATRSLASTRMRRHQSLECIAKTCFNKFDEKAATTPFSSFISLDHYALYSNFPLLSAAILHLVRTVTHSKLCFITFITTTSQPNFKSELSL